MFHFVYTLLSQKDNNFYIGYTTALKDRVKDHNAGKNISTRHRRPLDLIYFEGYLDKRYALGREKFLKSGSGHRYLNKQLKYYLKNKLK